MMKTIIQYRYCSIQMQNSELDKVQPKYEPSRIMTKEQRIQDLVLNHGFLKLKVISHLAVPTITNTIRPKSKTMLVPSNYTVAKLKQEIRRAFSVHETESLFLFYKESKVVQANYTLQQVLEKNTGNTLLGATIQFSIYSTQFA